MLFVAFGALVLVPLLTGLDPSIALFTAGIGTLVFQLITKRMVPIFLASSFAFIAPIQIGIQQFGLGETLGGLASASILYILLSALVKYEGVKVIEKYLPPIVTGPVIMVIGLKLAPVAVGMTKNFDGSNNIDSVAILVALFSLAVTIFVVLKGKGIFSLIPIITGIFAGYVLSIFLGKVNYQPVFDAAWFSIPWIEAMKLGTYELPKFDISAILFILPVAIAPAIEHVGDIIAISETAQKDYLDKPGLHRTLLGDGIATMIASFLGGPPNTTYSEVTGAVALLKRFEVKLMTIAALFAIALAFLGKLGAILKTIPIPVMGGIMVLLFGMIAAIGIASLVKNQVDMSKSRNLVIVAVILVFGIGDMSLGYGNFQLAGIGLAGIIGVLLNILLPKQK
ncbi:MAG: uracil-xanthine permease [Ignavibacteriales bacterium]|nr:uracil-xanthine permease [Ignavibacteriales bacterium]MCB9218908.1 uracil-xanthine permease [Ignavibacteriales bacterium]